MPTTARRAATTATRSAAGTTAATPSAAGPTAAAAPPTGTGPGEGTTTLAEAREEAAAGAAGSAGVGSPSGGAGGDATTTLAEAREEAAAAGPGGTAGVGPATASALRQVVSAPVTVAREVADDVASTLRRPDAVLYMGGVVALAVLGIVEWPVAAVAGVGLAIANGRRRARG